MSGDSLLLFDSIQKAMEDGYKGFKIGDGSTTTIRSGSFYVRLGGEYLFSSRRGKLEDVKSATPILLAPGERLVARTIERFELPTRFYGTLLPRVVLSVRGLDIAAGVIDPGYAGTLRLIITNLNSTPFALWLGAPLGKVSIWEKEHVSENLDFASVGISSNREDIDQLLMDQSDRLAISQVRKGRVYRSLQWGGILMLTIGLIFFIWRLYIKDDLQSIAAVVVAYLGFIAVLFGFSRRLKTSQSSD